MLYTLPMAETSHSPTVDSQLFYDVFNASPIGIAVENFDGEPLFVNPAFCAMLGFSQQELRGKHCVDFSPPEDAEKDWALFQQLKAGEIDHYQLEKRYFRRDGSLVWGRLSISLLAGRDSPLILAMVEDITDKKNAEEALRAREEQLRLAAEIGKMYAYTWDVTTDEVVRSSQHAAIFGISDQTRFTRQQLSERIHPADRAKWLASVADLTPGNPNHRTTYRVVRPDGSEVWLEKNARAFFDSSGNMDRVIGMVADVTERKLAEEALRTSEERLRLAQQIGHIGSFERDIKSGLVTWTAELESVYGLPEGSIKGTNAAFFEHLIHPADRAHLTELVDRALKTRQPTEGEWRVVWPDGSVHWIVGRWRVLMDDSGEPSRVVGVNMDVTGRKLAELTLNAREELLKTFVKNVPAAVAMLDTDMHYLQVSDRWCTDYLPGRMQILGRSHYELFPDMPERWKEVHRRALAGETLRADEDRWDGQDGPHWARWEVRPWKTLEGTVGGILILAEDITRRKQAEVALAGVSRKLIEAQEQERTRIARELHDDINQRLALLSVELTGAAKTRPVSPAAASLVLSETRERIDDISSDLQSLSRQLHSSQLEYLGIVAAARSLCREVAASQSVEIDFHGDDLRTPVSREASLCLFRILQEALHNAVKHSKVRHFEARLSGSEEYIQLTVSDHGVGFDPEAALKTGGLGLISMRERVRFLNGVISVDSKPAQGTTVRVRIPHERTNDLQKAV